MKAIREYGKLYLAIIGCFTLAAILAALAPGQTIPASGEGRGSVIYLDPGHGGEDGGAVSITGVQEKDINLEISLRLRDLLRFCGQSVRMTREGDRAVYDEGCTTIAQKKASDLRNRAAMLREMPGATLLSIHQNQFPEEKYRGAQVFYNAAEGSKALAEAMQAAIKALDPGNHREIKRSEGVYLMEQIDNTAVLIECGFLSNREEELLLRDESYQKKIACAVSAGLLNNICERSTV